MLSEASEWVSLRMSVVSHASRAMNFGPLQLKGDEGL